MNAILREIDNRISKKKTEMLAKELQRLGTETENHIECLDKIRLTYEKVLDKDKPVGKSVNAIRYLKTLR